VASGGTKKEKRTGAGSRMVSSAEKPPSVSISWLEGRCLENNKIRVWVSREEPGILRVLERDSTASEL